MQLTVTRPHLRRFSLSSSHLFNMFNKKKVTEKQNDAQKLLELGGQVRRLESSLLDLIRSLGNVRANSSAKISDILRQLDDIKESQKKTDESVADKFESLEDEVAKLDDLKESQKKTDAAVADKFKSLEDEVAKLALRVGAMEADLAAIKNRRHDCPLCPTKKKSVQAIHQHIKDKHNMAYRKDL